MMVERWRPSKLSTVQHTTRRVGYLTLRQSEVDVTYSSRSMTVDQDVRTEYAGETQDRVTTRETVLKDISPCIQQLSIACRYGSLVLGMGMRIQDWNNIVDFLGTCAQVHRTRRLRSPSTFCQPPDELDDHEEVRQMGQVSRSGGTWLVIAFHPSLILVGLAESRADSCLLL